MQVAIVEPFYSGSHKTWVDALYTFLSEDCITFTLPGRHWKWRMGAGAIQLAQEVNQSNKQIDVFLVTDMLDVAVFKSLLLPQYRSVKIVLYMHENQVVYPFQTSHSDKNRDLHYGLINYKSMLTADWVWFNSNFHRDILFSELEVFLKLFPEAAFHVKEANRCRLKSKVIPLGIDTESIDSKRMDKDLSPAILWNHRWEYDKNPDLFFNTLIRLSEEGHTFDLYVTGEKYSKSPSVFSKAESQLKRHVKHWGFVADRKTYYQILWRCNILPVTANQEFFGLSVLEAMYCGVQPLLPNRLSYSDLYAKLDVFYSSDDAFYDTLKGLVSNYKVHTYRSEVTNYGWKSVAKTYDKELIKVLQ